MTKNVLGEDDWKCRATPLRFLVKLSITFTMIQWLGRRCVTKIT